MRRSVVIVLFLLLAAYLCWEAYWYSRVGLSFIKWHTHLMVYVYLAVVVYALSGGRRGGAALAALSMLTILLVIEGMLLVGGRYATYVERREGSYVSPYGNPNTLHYNTYPPHTSHLLRTPEYSYMRKSNSLGFADAEWALGRTPGRKRILALGDSFTEGDGAPFDSSYVALMRQYAGDSFEVMNAGTCGSDPFNNYMNLADRLTAYRPDMIIQSLSSGDMNADILLRGGMERMHCSMAPWWEPLYAINCVSRVFFRAAGYSELLRKSNMTAQEKALVDSTMADLAVRYSTLCRRNGMQLMLVLHPICAEVMGGTYAYDFSAVLDQIRRDSSIHIIDLLPAYRAYIQHDQSTAADYYWPKDGHHNSRGYHMMAATTWQAIRPYLTDDQKEK